MTPEEHEKHVHELVAYHTQRVEQARLNYIAARRRQVRVTLRIVAMNLVLVLACSWVASLGERYSLYWWIDLGAALANAGLALWLVLQLPRRPIP